MTLETVVSVLAVAFTIVFAWPQVFRALRHGVSGISVGAISQSLVSAGAWCGYGLAQELMPVVVADVGVMTGQSIVTVLLVRHRAMRARWAAAVFVATGSLVVIAQVRGFATPIAVVAGVVALTSALTQLVEVMREPHKLEGLSAGTYGLLTIVACCWLAYGLLKSDAVIIATNIAMIPMSSYITWAASRSHHEPASVDASEVEPAR